MGVEKCGWEVEVDWMGREGKKGNYMHGKQKCDDKYEKEEEKEEEREGREGKPKQDDDGCAN